LGINRDPNLQKLKLYGYNYKIFLFLRKIIFEMKKITLLLTTPLFLFSLFFSCSSSEGDVPEPIQVDNIPPVITLIGETTIEIFRNTNFTDPGATAYDENDGDLSSSIETTGNVLVNTNGEYIITYTVNDAAGNTAHVERIVIVYDDGNPLVGDIANGGVIFWVNPQDDTHGLVAAISCESSDPFFGRLPWRPNLTLADCQYFGPYQLIGNTEIGGGLENTNRIIALNNECDGGVNTNYAAYFARNYVGGGYNDWYLPNIAEVELIHDNFLQIRQTVYSENCNQNGWSIAFAIDQRQIWSSNGALETQIGGQILSHATAGYSYSSFGVFQDWIHNKQDEKYVLPIRAY
jgi:hypothetical protein